MWFLHPPKSRRRWHVFTWLAAVPALVFVALVQVAGVEVDSPELLTARVRGGPTILPYDYSPSGSLPAYADPVPDRVFEYSHGWPCKWHQRAFGYHWTMWEFADSATEYRDLRSGNLLVDTSTDPSAISWLSAQAWPGSGDADASSFSQLGLVLNLFIAACIVALPMAATEFWLRRRGGPFRFKIIDFLAVSLVMACGFGFWRWDRGVQQRENEASLQATTQYALRNTTVDIDREYVGPEWLARLYGNPQAVPFLQRFAQLSLRISRSGEANLDWLGDLRNLRNAEIVIEAGSYPTILESFGSKTSLRELSLILDRDDRQTHKYVASLVEFQGLESISLSASPLVDDLLRLKALPRLRNLNFSPYLITTAELEQLKYALPNVEIYLYQSNDIPPHQREHIALARLNRQFDGRCDLTGDGHMLRWDGAPFTKENLQLLAAVLPTLRVLRIDESEMDPTTLPDLGRFRDVTHIMLWTSDLPVEFMDQLVDLPKLVKVSIHKRPAKLEPLLALQRHPSPILFIAQPELFSEEDQEYLDNAFGERLRWGDP